MQHFRKLPLLTLCSILLFLPLQIYADDINQQELSLFWGSIRVPYSVFASGIDYKLDHIMATDFSLESRLKSWGTPYIFSLSSFDTELAILYGTKINTIKIDAGLGYQIRSRLYVDERSSASTSYAPLLRAKLRIPIIDSDFDLDLISRLDLSLFVNGLDIKNRSELLFGYNLFFLGIQFEAEALSLYSNSTPLVPSAELRFDSYLLLGLRLQ